MDSASGNFSGSKNGLKLFHESASVNSDHNIVERFVDPLLLPSHSLPYNTSAAEDRRQLSTAMLKYMGEILMEDELEDKNCMLQNCVALLAAEKSFYDVLEVGPSPPPLPSQDPPLYNNAAVNNLIELEGIDELCQLEMYGLKRRKNQHPPNDEASKKLESKGCNGRTSGIKKKRNKREVVDLRALLTQCAQAVAAYNHRSANDILKLIRHHSSPFGDGSQRLAHFFANGLEARLAGTGLQIHTALATKNTSVGDMIKSYQIYVSACPFKSMSNTYANGIIAKLAEGANKLHIIDFGIIYGFQWPYLIRLLSLRPGGPPKLRITGIDFPRPGFRPSEMVEDAGRRLANYCNRFNVPFEYKGIAKQRWDTIKTEDMEIDHKNEVVVVNSINNRMENLLDETVTDKCLKDAVLELIRKMNPDIFIHGILNGNFNTPFFLTRFREALFHYDALFDMMEATVGREDEGRMMFEREMYGNIMNIIGCEGSERIQRPDIYKQWQGRNERAGLRQVELEEEIVTKVRSIVKEYHKDFAVEVDGGWMLHGWKGRVIYAISSWKPSHLLLL